MNELNKISGINITEEKLELRPSFKYEVLKSEESFRSFVDIWESFMAEATAYNSK